MCETNLNIAANFSVLPNVHCDSHNNNILYRSTIHDIVIIVLSSVPIKLKQLHVLHSGLEEEMWNG